MPFFNVAFMRGPLFFLLCLAFYWTAFVLMFLADNLLSDHDASGYLRDVVPSSATPLDTLPRPYFKFLRHWDGLHYTHISRYGYTHEHLFAFFPAIPFLIRLSESFFNDGLFPAIDWAPSVHAGPVSRSNMPDLILSFVNSLAFATAGLALHKLAWNFVRSPPAKRIMTLLNLHKEEQNKGRFVSFTIFFYLFLPAMPFVTVIYTDGIFNALALVGSLFLWPLEVPPRRLLALPEFFGRALASCACFVLASFCRSNGLLLCGHFAYIALMNVCTFYQERAHSAGRLCAQLLVMALCLAANLTPYIFWNWYGYHQSCVHDSAPTEQDCPKHWISFYGFIQRKYWNVSLFSAYTLHNMPNFLIPFPMLLFTLITLWRIGRAALAATAARKQPFSVTGWIAEIFHQSPIMGSPHFVLYYFMLLFGFLVMHVQVTQRFISSCAGFYFLMSFTVLSGLYSDHRLSRVISQVCLGWSMLWAALGIVLFGNFFPWT